MKTSAEFAFRLIASIAMTGGLVAFSDPALAAQTAIDHVQVQVDTADLNLATAAGHATAARRIRTAASIACAPDESLQNDYRICVANATRDAMAALGRINTVSTGGLN